jgi:anti-sigma factor RsiW
VSHLQEQLSALVDGELSGADLDRANAHLAACDQCRSEAATLRFLKRELRQLAAARPSTELTQRLIALAASEGLGQPPRPPAPPPAPSPPGRIASPGPRTPPRGYVDRPGTRRDDFAERARRSRPPQSPDEAWARRRRSRRLAWGAISFVVSVGIGAAAYSLGGGFPAGGRVTPQMELFNVGHAILGDLPVSGPSQQPSPRPSWAPSPRKTPLP